ncbi:MAG: phosphate ABC transporter substrate-binding protein [Planctomycetota bacterium]|nr:phosphate ABC transporter substrate-binding protein [Planctomycetota bacterium]MDA1213427.1 phosphate ABC transporter substrate-binding protein [Planctomycetota bacterium]
MSATLRRLGFGILIVGQMWGASLASAQVTVDPKLPTYKPTTGVSGTIKSVGSDTMNNLMTIWAEGFNKFYPNVKVEIEGKGSATAPTALIEGTALFGPMSRDWKKDEIDAFQKKFGYEPVTVATSIDLLAVYVNKDNPIEGLSLPHVDAIFSKNRSLGFPDDISTWGQLELKDDWANAPISLYGRNSASGTYAYFKEHALGKGDFKDTVKEQPGSSAVIQAVTADKFAIGYSGIGYKTADVRALPLANKEGGDLIEPDPENAYNGTYPLARGLILSVNYKPNSKLDPLRREFLKYVFSKQGQQGVVKDGYIPVTAVVAEKALSRVGIAASSGTQKKTKTKK